MERGRTFSRKFRLEPVKLVTGRGVAVGSQTAKELSQQIFGGHLGEHDLAARGRRANEGGAVSR